MVLRLEITVYYISVRTSVVLKVSLDHNFYVLMYVVGLDHISILFLYRSTKYLFLLLSSTPLYRTLVTLYIHTLVLLITELVRLHQARQAAT